MRSCLLYCSPVWCPNLSEDILHLILKLSNIKNYKFYLTSLSLLPLMMQFELADIIFFVKSIKSPSSHFNIMNYFCFSSCGTISSPNFEIHHHFTKFNSSKHFYFRKFPCLWSSLPILTLIFHYSQQLLFS